MKTILFQGDSITDAGRSRDHNNYMGQGYPHLIKASFNATAPLAYTFYNRGISGNRIVDVYARIKADIINLAPDFMSILIGVNDVWHELAFQNGVDTDKYERIYSMLIEEVRTALPDVKILIMEPFVLPASATTGELEDGRDKYAVFRTEVAARAAAARRVAQKYDLPFLPLQEVFDKACESAPADYWLSDGVHPTEAGHALIAKLWSEKFNQIQ